MKVFDARDRRLLDTAPDAIVVVDETGRIEIVNQRTEALFGYARDELTRQPVEVLIPERLRGDRCAHLRGYFSSPKTRPMGLDLELFGLRKDGTEVPIEVSLNAYKEGAHRHVSAAIRDITERKRRGAETHLVAERLARAVESIQDAFALFDADDRLISCNSAFRRLTGTAVGESYEEILDRGLHHIDFPSEAASAAFRSERLANRREATTSFDIRMRDGRRLRVTDRRTPEGGIVTTVWDLTEDEHRVEEVREARAAAEAASAEKSVFLSAMSHELRTPLNAILGFAQLLGRDKKEPLSPRHKDRVEQILRGGQHLLHLIDDILDLARIEAGRLAISIEPVEVGEVLAEVRETLEPIAARQGIRLEIPSLPERIVVRVDRIRFVQILMNFGSNAIKYNRPSGSVRITVTAGRRVRVAVIDTGIGVPTDKQAHLFQPFQRAGQESGPIEGTGIGLVITKRLAELMNGTTGFHSVPGTGSEFWVDLELHDAPPPSIEIPKPMERALVATSSGPRPLVLYVEDNPANVVFMRDLMSSFDDIELVTVSNAELGVEVTRARKPAVVLMDINLPGMSGLDALRILHADPETKDIPIIALTAAALERDKKRGMEAGFRRYLTKPIKVEELLSALEDLLAPTA